MREEFLSLLNKTLWDVKQHSAIYCAEMENAWLVAVVDQGWGRRGPPQCRQKGVQWPGLLKLAKQTKVSLHFVIIKQQS